MKTKSLVLNSPQGVNRKEHPVLLWTSLSLFLLLEGDHPFCIMYFPFCQERFLGLPEEREKEIYYRWIDKRGERCVPVLPNRDEVFQDLALSFFF